MGYNLTNEDKKLIQKKNITERQIEKQLESYKTGFPYLRLSGAAGTENGIMRPTEKETAACIEAWNAYKALGHRITKFVPASGAASRMFKNLFEFLDAPYDVPTNDFERKFFGDIHLFAFFPILDAVCMRNEGKGIDQLMAELRYKAIVANLLKEKGLDYGHLPKGLLLFHKYDDCMRTPVEEHLAEAALYASSRRKADVHFTISAEHKTLFQKLVNDVLPIYEQKYGVQYHVSFSEQKSSTDTIAANMDNSPFRDENGQLLFRPGGHGALLENLNDLDSDIVFIKNIDNVVPDRLKAPITLWKQIIAGILVKTQEKAFSYLRMLDEGTCSHETLTEIAAFVQKDLCCLYAGTAEMDDVQLSQYLYTKLNRPMRVCGVVRNVGEPGGGPFLAYNSDGSVSLQILESSQISPSNPEYVKMFKEGTHFNPVDLCCAIRDYKGGKFPLANYTDPATGFISQKSKNGRELKALELPGLWNGAMSNWNTIMVEVPLATFNPVKTVNDLLREQHQ